jgi:hypothetical protein
MDKKKHVFSKILTLIIMKRQVFSFLYRVNTFFIFIFSVNGECCTDLFYSRPRAAQNSTNQMFCTIKILSTNEIECLNAENTQIKKKNQKQQNGKKFKTEYKILLNPNNKQEKLTIQDNKTNYEYTFTIFYDTQTVGFYTNERKYYITKTLLAKGEQEIQTNKQKTLLNNDTKNKIRINID